MDIQPWKFILKQTHVGKLKHTAEFSKCEKVCTIVRVINKSIKPSGFLNLKI